MNPVLEFVKSLVDEGMRPNTVAVEPHAGGLRVRVEFLNKHSLGEGENLPHHTVEVDRENMPEGVTLSGWQRFPARTLPIEGSKKEIETWMLEVASYGKAPDVAWIGETCLTKPIEWLPEPMRSFVLKKYYRSEDNQL